ncbi:MAG: FlgD immunoglobulin-like domain containing protein [Candidatus Krumholzibacteria bacterium]|jgi:hypothetical protein|nr:FlgD immunoglobulin-like domain containing protein [Candidatus Krumholzibacteria bacterium]
MKYSSLFAPGIFVLVLLFAIGALAADDRQITRDGLGMWYGAPALRDAKVDTVYLLGGPDRWDGKFQDAAGQPAWHGWTSADLSVSGAGDDHWSVTDEVDLVIGGSYSLWCGVDYPDLGFGPQPGFGYGNNWDQRLLFAYTVPDNAVASAVVWTMKLRYDTEPGYDIVYLEWQRAGQWITLASYSGNGYSDVTRSFQVQPGQYGGPDGDQVQLRVRFASDNAWSDEDALYPTERGACQIDDVTVTVGGVLVDAEDFESGTMGAWQPLPTQGAGDFAALYSSLYDVDPCHQNYSPQVAFVDDGLVVPGTDGTMCISWCYGPGGYIVNNTGGLLGHPHGIKNIVKSPVLEWPGSGYEGAHLAYDAYRHTLLGDPWPGIFDFWYVRSVDTGRAEDIEFAPWRSNNFFYYGGPLYSRSQRELSALLVPGVTHLQVALGLQHTVNPFAPPDYDGTPAPYFDNVAVAAYPFAGPAISAREIDLAQDGFPASGYLDYGNLANNAVRFDMAANVAPAAQLINRPGDSLIVDVVALGAGAALADRPQMHVKMKANPLFDGVRVLPAGFTHTPGEYPDAWGLIEGWVYGDSTYTAVGQLIPDRWHFDLPDDDFFFPGDVIHYCFKATDNFGRVSTLPGDLQGFGAFDNLLSFPKPFVTRALPTMFSAVPGDQPRMLFWEDAGGQRLDYWHFALSNGGYQLGAQFDLYYTSGASSGVGNGLGGRATSPQIAHYDVLVYTCGTLAHATLSDGSPGGDPGDDLGLLDAWFSSGNKGAFMMGDNLVSSLVSGGAAGQAFVADYLGVSLVSADIRSLINNQVSPLARAIPGNGVISRIETWRVVAGCPTIGTIDAVVADGAQRLAEFANSNGQWGTYSYAAASQHINADVAARIVSMPHTFDYIQPAPGYVPPAWAVGKPVRGVILDDILYMLGISGGLPSDVAPDAALAVSNFPNPFNPTTTIRLNLPRDGDVSVKVFNVRGELVKTLVHRVLPAGTHDVLWDGSAAGGRQAASGVYFWETRFGGDIKVGKMLLAK